MASFSATAACAVVATLHLSAWLVLEAQKPLCSVTIQGAELAVMASGAWAVTRTPMSIQACVALEAEIPMASFSANVVRVVLIRGARVAGIALATLTPIRARVAVVAATQKALFSGKAVFAVAILMAPMAAHAHVERVQWTLARASWIADLIPVDSARVITILSVVAFADEI